MIHNSCKVYMNIIFILYPNYTIYFPYSFKHICKDVWASAFTQSSVCITPGYYPGCACAQLQLVTAVTSKSTSTVKIISSFLTINYPFYSDRVVHGKLPSIVCIVNICMSAAVVSWYWHYEKDQPELKMSAIARPQLTSEPAYKALQDYFNKNGSSLIMRDMFKADPNRFSKFR